MSHLPLYTSLTAAALIILQMGLMLPVGLTRFKHQQSLGDGGHADLLMAIRRHGNLTENAPLFVAVLALIEILTGSSIVVAIFGAGFVFARIAHAVGLTVGDGPNAGRAIGAFGTLLLSLASGGYLFYSSIMAI